MRGPTPHPKLDERQVAQAFWDSIGPMKGDGFDDYQGMSWSERAKLDPLRAGLDPRDDLGRKNAHIDRVQRHALLRGLAEAQILRGVSSVRALDFGCGGGRMFATLARWTDELWGLDRNVEMVELARRLNVMPPERVVVWDGQGAPPVPTSFDLIVSIGVTLTPELLESVAPELAQIAGERCVLVLIEQTDRGRGLTIERYRRTFAESGFVLRSERPVRLGTRSPFARIARQPLPSFVAAAAARAELAFAPTIHSSAAYVDHLMVLTRESADRAPSA